MQMVGNMHCNLEDLQFVGGVQYKKNAARFGPKQHSNACYETATLRQYRPSTKKWHKAEDLNIHF
jgi:hypothetical protein